MSNFFHDGPRKDDDVIHREVDSQKIHTDAGSLKEQIYKIEALVRACEGLAFDDPNVHKRESPMNPIHHVLEIVLKEMDVLVHQAEQLERESEPKYPSRGMRDYLGDAMATARQVFSEPVQDDESAAIQRSILHQQKKKH
ncbi:hypothetical protein PVW53_05385 [Seohaeicola sp. SP36]|uniref:hypothetical protein n=1 Tax=unclassified Seohaeicola TaxID=2641111 RepID=UPI00237A66BE|nr:MULTISPECIES: hypothetical protein [unclassified Seohaeicola]MDD9708765.1 hypothetical protein [Seohaeicola sp. 4SK31]MDD9734944.1 hypothetical protein [Seohaeicola sp. SP36]